MFNYMSGTLIFQDTNIDLSYILWGLVLGCCSGAVLVTLSLYYDMKTNKAYDKELLARREALRRKGTILSLSLSLSLARSSTYSDIHHIRFLSTNLFSKMTIAFTHIHTHSLMIPYNILFKFFSRYFLLLFVLSEQGILERHNEFVYYDAGSMQSRLFRFLCCPHYGKITSERILYSQEVHWCRFWQAWTKQVALITLMTLVTGKC